MQKARSGCRSGGIDHHGTIHMLRDDLKKLFKEHTELKQELVDKQRTITSLAADLRKAKINVKEQLGTARTLDEQILDRAAKDQLMALRRRVKVLEMEKEKMQKGASIRETYQKQGDEELTRKKSSGRIGARKGEKDSSVKSEPSGSTDRADKSGRTDKTALSDKAGTDLSIDDTDNILDVSFMSEDVNSVMSQEIELRDNLIQELELRVRELKQELSMKDIQQETSAAKASHFDATDVGIITQSRDLNEGSVILADLESLRLENARLQRQLSKQKNALLGVETADKGEDRQKLQDLEKEIEAKDSEISSLVKENRVLKVVAGKDWKRKEIVLVESEIADDEREKLEASIVTLKKEVKCLDF